MRNTLVGAAALAAAVLLTSPALAGGKSHSIGERHAVKNEIGHQSAADYTAPRSRHSVSEDFAIRRMMDVGDGETYALGTWTDDKVKALQAEIRSNPAAAAKFRAHGINIKHVIGRTTAVNGRVIYYVQ